MYLQQPGTDGANDKLMEIGQRSSNTTAGDYKGVKIVQYTGSAVSDGYLQAGELQIDNININGNTIISNNTNGAITLTPNGTGLVGINGGITLDGITGGDYNQGIRINGGAST